MSKNYSEQTSIEDLKPTEEKTNTRTKNIILGVYYVAQSPPVKHTERS